HVELKWAWPVVPTVHLRGVRIENAQWASTREPMAVASEAAFTFALKGLWSERTIVTRLLLVDAVINMERKADGLRNWRLKDPEDRGPGTVRVMSLTALRSKLHFINEAIDFEIAAETKPAEEPS